MPAAESRCACGPNAWSGGRGTAWGQDASCLLSSCILSTKLHVASSRTGKISFMLYCCCSVHLSPCIPSTSMLASCALMLNSQPPLGDASVSYCPTACVYQHSVDFADRSPTMQLHSPALHASLADPHVMNLYSLCRGGACLHQQPLCVPRHLRLHLLHPHSLWSACCCCCWQGRRSR